MYSKVRYIYIVTLTPARLEPMPPPTLATFYLPSNRTKLKSEENLAETGFKLAISDLNARLLTSNHYTIEVL